jgi:hypothetical protein
MTLLIGLLYHLIKILFMNEKEFEIKLIKSKITALESIRSCETTLHYHIKSGAEDIRKIFYYKKDYTINETTEFTKEEIASILNYIDSVRNDSMYNYKGNSYLKEYYIKKDAQLEILKTL